MAEYHGTAQISFAQIDYYLGRGDSKKEWGVRVATKGSFPSPGDVVLVRKANGETQRVTVGSMVHEDRGAFPAPARYYSIAYQGGSPCRREAQVTHVCSDAIRRSGSKADCNRCISEIALNALREEYRQTRATIRDIEENAEHYDGERDEEKARLESHLAEIVEAAEKYGARPRVAA